MTAQQAPVEGIQGLRRSRRVMVAACAAAGGLTAGITACFAPYAALGVVLGAAAGTVPFWLFGRRVEQFSQSRPEMLSMITLRWTLLRAGSYAAALSAGYLLDPAHVHGLLGALGGIYIPRLVLVFFAVTGMDLKLAGKPT